MRISTVLFDLDGTFADTAPDLAYALNCLRAERGLADLPFIEVREHTSNGANALLKLGFDLTPDDAEFAEYRSQFLSYYQSHIARETRLFDGMDELIDQLDVQKKHWGIVTNKPAYLTDPLMLALAINSRTPCIVSGDTTPHAKPHPASLLYATEILSVNPENCLYVGDAERDIEAGKRAGMHTLVARFGYLSSTDKPETWQADGMIDHPLEILDWLN